MTHTALLEMIPETLSTATGDARSMPKNVKAKTGFAANMYT